MKYLIFKNVILKNVTSVSSIKYTLEDLNAQRDLTTYTVGLRLLLDLKDTPNYWTECNMIVEYLIEEAVISGRITKDEADDVVLPFTWSLPDKDGVRYKLLKTISYFKSEEKDAYSWIIDSFSKDIKLDAELRLFLNTKGSKPIVIAEVIQANPINNEA